MSQAYPSGLSAALPPLNALGLWMFDVGCFPHFADMVYEATLSGGGEARPHAQWLRGYWAGLDHICDPEDRFVFGQP